jgi:thioredoxin-related protein
MKKIHIAIALIIAVAWVAASCRKASEEKLGEALQPADVVSVTWQDFNTGLKLAKEQNKAIIIDFYADWCGWCKRMEAMVFNDSEVAEKLKKNFICIRIHTDTAEDNNLNYKNHVLTKQEFAAMLGVQGLPTVVFMDKDGNTITTIPGFVDKGVFLPLLGYINEGCYQKQVALQDYIDGKVHCGK